MMIKTMIPINPLEAKPFLFFPFTSELHAKRLTSLSDAMMGAMMSHSLQPSKMGDGLAEAKGLLPKHARKQVDRFISNKGIDDERCQIQLARSLISNRKRIIVAMDWTVFAKDGHMTITLRLITTHGRATPLLWKTVSVKGLKGHKNEYVFSLLDKLKRIISKETEVIVLADREFGTLNQMKKMKDELNFDYILRIKRNFTITDKQGIKKLAFEWLNKKAPRCIDDGKITIQDYPVKKVVIAKEQGMKAMWCLACSLSNIATQTILNLYGKRWSTETSYRDEKDIYFGMGLKKARIKCVARRERLLLISAIIIIFLTLLGAASEAAEFDKFLKSNTVKRRTHSLFTQGKLLLKLLHKLPDKWKNKIMPEFQQLCQQARDISIEQFVI